MAVLKDGGGEEVRAREDSTERGFGAKGMSMKTEVEVTSSVVSEGHASSWIMLEQKMRGWGGVRTKAGAGARS